MIQLIPVPQYGTDGNNYSNFSKEMGSALSRGATHFEDMKCAIVLRTTQPCDQINKRDNIEMCILKDEYFCNGI